MKKAVFLLLSLMLITSLGAIEFNPSLLSGSNTKADTLLLNNNKMQSTVRLESGTLTPKSKIVISVTFNIPEGLYQQFTPEYFTIRLEKQKWLKVGKVIYPELPKKGKYNGNITLRLPITITKKAPKEIKSLTVTAIYQMCEDSGLCLMPAENQMILTAEMAATSSSIEEQTAADSTEEEGISVKTVMIYLLMALAGGIILNVMPCVLPVLPIKAMSLIKQSQEKPGEILIHTALYSAGVITSMLSVATILIIIQSLTGNLVMWGSLNQSGIFLLIMLFLLFIFALSLLDVFTLLPPTFAASSKGGRVGAFASGLLVVLLGTSCTAPLLAPVAGFFLSQPPLLILLFFFTVGVGFALPFWVMVFKIKNPLKVFIGGSIANIVLILILFPLYLIESGDNSFLKMLDQQFLLIGIGLGALELMFFIPIFKILKPGEWMNHLKKLMGLAMMGVAALFLEIFLKPDPDYIFELIVVLILTATALWVYGKLQVKVSKRWVRWLILIGMTLSVSTVGLWQLKDVRSHLSNKNASKNESSFTGKKIISRQFMNELSPRFFNEEEVLKSIENGEKSLIIFSADWCMTCKSNEKLIFNQPDTIDFLKKTAVQVYFGDFTHSDPVIAAWIQKYNRGGVPVYIINPGKGKNPFVLPDALTKKLLFELITEAIKSEGVENVSKTRNSTPADS